MIIPTPLKAGEVYATAADIRDCADLPETPFTPGVSYLDGSFEPYWTRPDGTPMTVLIRALSLADRRAIEQAAPAGDDMAWVLETCFYALKEPRLSRDQLKEMLATKNPAPLIQINDTAWELSDFPAQLVTREVRRVAGLADEAEPAEQPPARPKRKRTATEPAP